MGLLKGYLESFQRHSRVSATRASRTEVVTCYFSLSHIQMHLKHLELTKTK